MRRTGVRVSIFRNFIIHQIFSEFLQPLRDSEFHGSPRSLNNVSSRSFCDSFLLGFGFFIGLANIGSPWSLINHSWHSNWRDVTFSSILLFSSLGFTYCRWWRRAWRRCWAMTPLSWKCPWGWWIRPRGRTWQAWNHNRNEVLRVAKYPNPVFDEMWFLTIDPFIGISVFIAKLSKRQYCWHPWGPSLARVCPSLWCELCLFMRLHFSIGVYDYRRIARFRQGIHFSITQVLLLIMCIDAPESTTNSRSSGLRLDAGRHLFSEGEKNVALSCSFNFNTLLPSFHAASRAPCSCHSVSSWDRSSNFGALGLRSRGSPGQIYPSEGFWSRV